MKITRHWQWTGMLAFLGVNFWVGDPVDFLLILGKASL
jgi:hypothetical protein